MSEENTTEKVLRKFLPGLEDFVIPRIRRIRKFAWLPIKVYRHKYYQDGFVWLDFAYLDEDGLHYRYPFEMPEIPEGSTIRVKRPTSYEC